MKRIRITMLMVIALTFSASVIQAQKLLGLVVEKNAEGVDEPIPGANIFWLGTTIGTSTAENGVFMIERVEGADRLVVSFVGYQTDTITISNQTSIKVTLQSNQ